MKKSNKYWSLAFMGLAMMAISCDKDDDSEDAPVTPPVTLVGIQGQWQSSGSDVAPILGSLFATDSIYADFRTDFTYLVEQYDSTGAMLTLSGVYTQTLSDVDGIYNVEVNQSTPAALVSQGIAQVTGNTMLYEIVQTSPDIGAIPPTAEGGFGSTNGGALGTINVQTYQRIE
jgi:hypothetical protein